MGKKNKAKVDFEALIDEKGDAVKQIYRLAIEAIKSSLNPEVFLTIAPLGQPITSKEFYSIRAESHCMDLFILLFGRKPKDCKKLDRAFLDFIFDKARKEVGSND